MKRLISILAIGLVMLIASCDKEQQAVQHLFVTETVLEAGAKGETVTVSYNLVSPVDGEVVKTKVVSGEDMLGNITQPATGVIRIEVKANSGDKREAIIEVSYINETTSVIIEQAAGNGNTGGNGGNNDGEEVRFTALCLDGYYYGEKYGEGADRYAFFLSDQGLNNADQAYTNGTYYYIDAFAPVTGSTTIPNGIYHFDSKNTGAPNTINSENSQLILTTESVENTQIKYFENATMMVSENKIVLEVVIDGTTHKVTYTGGLELKDATEDNGGGGNDNPVGGQDGEAQSTLEQDHHVTFEGEHRAKWLYEGDYWQTGYSNYTIYIMNKAGGVVYGDTLQFDIITDNTSKDGKFAGKYKISNTPGKMVMVAGFTNNYAQAVGSWYYEYGGGSASGYKNYAMLKSGEAEFIDNGDGTHTVTLNACDFKGNNITCNWTGVIEED